jgi:hypothetical protein
MVLEGIKKAYLVGREDACWMVVICLAGWRFGVAAEDTTMGSFFPSLSLCIITSSIEVLQKKHDRILNYESNLEVGKAPFKHAQISSTCKLHSMAESSFPLDNDQKHGNGFPKGPNHFDQKMTTNIKNASKRDNKTAELPFPLRNNQITYPHTFASEIVSPPYSNPRYFFLFLFALSFCFCRLFRLLLATSFFGL